MNSIMVAVEADCTDLFEKCTSLNTTNKFLEACQS